MDCGRAALGRLCARRAQGGEGAAVSSELSWSLIGITKTRRTSTQRGQHSAAFTCISRYSNSISTAVGTVGALPYSLTTNDATRSCTGQGRAVGGEAKAERVGVAAVATSSATTTTTPGRLSARPRSPPTPSLLVTHQGCTGAGVCGTLLGGRRRRIQLRDRARSGDETSVQARLLFKVRLPLLREGARHLQRRAGWEGGRRTVAGLSKCGTVGWCREM